MKLLLLLMCPPTMASAQFFNQKATQVRYLEQQIAALSQYMTTAEQGYRIVRQGLTTIKGFTQGEFNLHTGFFNRLEWINPAILNDQSQTNAQNNVLPAAVPSMPANAGTISGSGTVAAGRF